MWRKGKGQERKEKTNVGRHVLIFLCSKTKDTAGGVGGCQSGNGASSICHLSFSLSSRYLFSLRFPLSTPLSCCFWLLVGVLQRQINRGDCLFLPVGNNSALLTLYYLALGYLNPLIYYREHSVMISSTLDMSAWHSGCVRGAEPPPSPTTLQTHARNELTHRFTHKLTWNIHTYIM